MSPRQQTDSGVVKTMAAMERMSLRVPNANVVMAARLRGAIDERAPQGAAVHAACSRRRRRRRSQCLSTDPAMLDQRAAAALLDRALDILRRGSA